MFRIINVGCWTIGGIAVVISMLYMKEGSLYQGATLLIGYILLLIVIARLIKRRKSIYWQ